MEISKKQNIEHKGLFGQVYSNIYFKNTAAIYFLDTRHMKINTNSWNKFRYTLYTPFYNSIARYFHVSRKLSIDSLQIKSGDKVLIIGAGTGLDLEFLPKDCIITATDITPSMVEQIKKLNTQLKCNVDAKVMDGQALEFADEAFDAVVLHLILAVIPDPIACIREAERVLKAGGKVAIFDKFVPKNVKISVARRALNLITNLMFSDITREFESIISSTKLTVLGDEPADFNGNFRLIKLKKTL